MARALAAALIAAAALCAGACGRGEGDGFRVGMLFDFSGGLAEFGEELERGVVLAVEHVNAAGGVGGRPVEIISADTQADPNIALEEARRLIETAGVDAIVGSLSSAETLAVARLAAESRIPFITPTATSPQICLADDDDFAFAATIDDAGLGATIAELAEALGHERAGLLWRDDAWGQGLATAFLGAYAGDARPVAFRDGQASRLAELQQAAQGGARTLVLFGFPPETERILIESAEQGLFDRYLVADSVRTLSLLEAVGPGILAGTYGAAAVADPELAARGAWEAARLDRWEEPPRVAFVHKAYDAALGLALAAQAAGPPYDGARIRDAIRRIGAAPGLQARAADIAGIQAGLEVLAEGGDIDFEGASIPFEFNRCGGIERGLFSIWRFTETGIEDLGAVPYPGHDESDIRAIIDAAGG